MPVCLSLLSIKSLYFCGFFFPSKKMASPSLLISSILIICFNYLCKKIHDLKALSDRIDRCLGTAFKYMSE